MNPAQLLNPKAFAKEQAAKTKAAKRTPNYGMFNLLSLHPVSFTGRSCHVVIFSLYFHTLLCRRVIFVARDDWCLDLLLACERDCTTMSAALRTVMNHNDTNHF